MKKGQISMFIILGLVIVAAFAFVLYIASSVTTGKLEDQRRQTISSVLEARVIDVYTSVCAEDALKEGLVLLGKQGGYIYQDQGGFDTPETLDFQDSRVTYLIKPSFDWQPIPAYPCLPGLGNFPRFCKYPETGLGNYMYGNFPAILQELYSGPRPISQQLGAFINKRMEECTDFDTFLEEEGLGGYEVEQEEPETDVIFTSESVIAKITYPLKIKIGGREPVMEIFNFNAEVKVRFADLHEAVKYIVEKDTTELDYNFSSDDFLSIKGLSSVDYEVYPHLDGEVAVLKDYWSTINGQNYTFQFARRNRPPVISYVSKNESDHNLYDYLVLVGENIVMTAEGGDPDEQENNYWFEGDFGFVDGTGFSKPATAAGYYNVTINTTDNNLVDYQLVRVLVDPKLEGKFEISNPYDDIPNYFVSMEDPVFFNSSLTRESLDHYTNYTFIWSISGEMSYYSISDTCFALPGKVNCSESFDILSIGNQMFSNPGVKYVYLNTILNYDNFQQTTTDPTIKNMTVRQCLPHRSDDPPYPYNTGDAFMANHSCCIEYNIADAEDNVVCHVAENYYCVNDTVIWSNSTPRYCDGTRGNICNGSFGVSYLEPKNICGRSDVTGCDERSWCVNNYCLDSGYHPECEGLYSYQMRINEGWCYDDHGCNGFCEDEVVAPHWSDNQFGDHGKILDNDYVCACKTDTMGQYCDKNHDGWFTGRCNQNKECACDSNSCTET